MPRKRSKPRFAPSSGSESMEYSADVEDIGVCVWLDENILFSIIITSFFIHI